MKVGKTFVVLGKLATNGLVLQKAGLKMHFWNTKTEI